MRFYIVSDLHLEFSYFHIPNNVEADIAILAGDICLSKHKKYKDFISSASKKFMYVLIIMGNHEAYHNSIDKSVEEIEEICDCFENVIFLNNQYNSIMHGNTKYSFIGTILWSDIKKTQESEILMSMNDFYLIKDYNIAKYKKEYLKNVEFITNAIAELTSTNSPSAGSRDQSWALTSTNSPSAGSRDQPEHKIIVITHHAPITFNTSDPIYSDSTISSAFQSDLTHLIKPPIVAWIYGHTHWSNMQEYNGVKLISNQRGYPQEKINFDENFVIEL
jgi:predicted phosphodiesterase